MTVMTEYLSNLRRNFFSTINLLKTHPELFISIAGIIAVSSIRNPFVQFIGFLLYLTFSFSIPKFFLNTEPSMKKRFNDMASEMRKNMIRLVVFALIIYTATRFTEKQDYIESYLNARSSFFYLFLNGYYQFVIIAATVFFSVRRLSVGQSIIDALVFSLTHLTFNIISCLLLMPLLYIKPLFVLNPYDFGAILIEEFGIIAITAWILSYMKSKQINLSEIIKAPEPKHMSGNAYAGNFRRITAAIIDWVIFISIFTIIIPLFSAPIHTLTGFNLQFNIWYYTAAAAVYTSVSWFLLKGRTFGKLAMGIQIVHADGTNINIATIILRAGIITIEVFALLFLQYLNQYDKYYLLESVFCMFVFSGSFWSIFTKNKQSLHDRLADTVVLKKNTHEV